MAAGAVQPTNSLHRVWLSREEMQKNRGWRGGVIFMRRGGVHRWRRCVREVVVYGQCRRITLVVSVCRGERRRR